MPLRPFQPTPPGCIELVFRFQLFGIPLVIVIWVCLDSGIAPDATVIANVAAAGDSWMHFDLMGELSSDLAYLGVTATDGSSSTGLQSSISHAGGIAGSLALPSLPSQCAQVVTLLTIKRGRSYRGRTFIPGVPFAKLDADTQDITPAYDIDLFNAYQAIISRMAGVGAKQSVISRVNGGVRRTTCESNVVTGRRVNKGVETLRRRSASAHA